MLTKRNKLFAEKVDHTKFYPAVEAFDLLKTLANAKFDESVDVSINLGVDPRKSDQVVRSSTVLPHGSGRKVRVAVFAQGDNAEKATAAGADIVGFEDLAESIKAGNMDFDVLIATPDAMSLVGRLGPVLGPRGLMPNPKVGTVTVDVTTAVNNAKAGQVRYRTDKAGIIHCSVGRASFEPKQLIGNLQALIADLKKLKPESVKGTYLKKISVSTTMGPGVLVDQATLA